MSLTSVPSELQQHDDVNRKGRAYTIAIGGSLSSDQADEEHLNDTHTADAKKCNKKNGKIDRTVATATATATSRREFTRKRDYQEYETERSMYLKQILVESLATEKV